MDSTKRPEDWTDEEIYQEIGKIVSKYKILECDKCVQAVMAWLKENGLKGKIIQLKK